MGLENICINFFFFYFLCVQPNKKAGVFYVLSIFKKFIFIDNKVIKDLEKLKAYLMDKESVELILRNISGNTWYDRYESIEVEDVHYYEFEN